MCVLMHKPVRVGLPLQAFKRINLKNRIFLLELTTTNNNNNNNICAPQLWL